MRVRHAFVVGDHEESMVSNAGNLAKLFNPKSSREIKPAKNLKENTCFDGMTEEDMKEMVFLGHGNAGTTHETGTYGGYTAKQFAKAMSDRFKNKPDQKKNVENLYLIGCDMGLIRADGGSLAQDIANELYKAGFANVKVHSIAQPPEADGESLYVETIENLGSGDEMIRRSGLRPIEPGYISAYIFNKKDGDEFFELLKDKKKNNAKIKKLKAENAFEFITKANPVVELNKPHNTFIPNEKLEVRNDRIAKSPYKQLEREQQQAIELLQKRCEYKGSKKKNKKLVRKLQFIISQLKKTQPEDWKDFIKRYTSYLEVKILGIKIKKLNERKGTLQLLTHLGNGDFVNANEIINKQKKIESSKDKTKDKKVKVEMKVEKKEKKEKEVEKGKDQAKVKEKDAPSIKTQPTPDELKLTAAKEKIDALLKHYNEQIATLDVSNSYYRHSFEINTKTQKRDALLKLKNSTSFSDMKNTAESYMKDKRVMLDWNTRLTRDLLETIVRRSDELLKKEVQKQDADVKPKSKVSTSNTR